MLRRHTISLLVLAVTFLCARPAWGQIADVTPSLDVSTRDDFNMTRTEENRDVTNTSFIRQSHLVSLDIPLSPVFLLALNMLYTDLDTRTDSRTEDGVQEVLNSSNETFEPRAELLWDNPYYSWNNGFRFRKADIQSDVLGVTRTQDNYFSRFNAEEDTYFPRTDVRYEWVRRSDNLLVPETDTNENRIDVDLIKHLGPFKVNYNLTGNRNDDDISNVIRDRIDQLGIVTYNQSFFKNIVSVFSEYKIDASREITRTPPTGGSIEEVRTATRALYLQDTNDGDTSDDDINVSIPDLINGDTVTPTTPTINLNQQFHNMVEELQIPQEVNKIYIYLGDTPTTTSEATLDTFTWQVFTSNTAADQWSAPIAGITTDFVPTENRFEITLPAGTTVRFFRVRNPNNLTETLRVSEMELIGEETFLEKVRRVEENYNQDFTSRVTLQPLQYLSFIYDFFYSEINTRPIPDQSLERFNSGTVLFTPHPIFNMTLRYQRNFFDLAGDVSLPETEDRYSAAITSTPLPTLTQSVTFSRLESTERQQVGDVDKRREDTFFYSLTGEVFRGFTMGMDVDWFRTWDYEQALPADITSEATLRVDAQLRPDLRVSGDYTAGRRRGGDRPNAERISTGEFIVTFRPTPRINSEAVLQFQTEEDTKGLDQEYRINWIVFTGGSVDVVVDYRYERTENTSEETHRGGLTTHWKVNNKLTLDFGWNVFSENNGDRLLRHSGTVNLFFHL